MISQWLDFWLWPKDTLFPLNGLGKYNLSFVGEDRGLDKGFSVNWVTWILVRLVPLHLQK